MEKYNFKVVENKWQKSWETNKSFSTKVDYNKKNFLVLKCFLTHLEKFIWGMSETTQLVIF